MRQVIFAALACLAVAAEARAEVGVLHLAPLITEQPYPDYYAGAYKFLSGFYYVNQGYAFNGFVNYDGNLGTSSGEAVVFVARNDGLPFSLQSIDVQLGNANTVGLDFGYADGSSSGQFVHTPVDGSLGTITLDQSNLIDFSLSSYGGAFAIQNLVLSDPSATPEPSAWALMLAGLGMLGGLLRVAKARHREDEARRMTAA